MRKPGAADIATRIRREIFTGNLNFNDRLPAERRLAEEYGVARNTVREALSQLEAEEFVQIRAGSGTYVIHKRIERGAEAIEHANPLELIDTRFALEPHICRLCVLHGRRSDFDKLESLCIHMENSVDDPTAFAEADTSFHAVLAEATRNGLLIWIIGQINNVRSQDEWTRMRHVTLDERIITQYNAQHRQILNAIRTREPERAANVMKEHLETARLSLTRARVVGRWWALGLCRGLEPVDVEPLRHRVEIRHPRRRIRLQPGHAVGAEGFFEGGFVFGNDRPVLHGIRLQLDMELRGIGPRAPFQRLHRAGG